MPLSCRLRKRRWGEADRLARLMNAQPVVVGHHSEKRHRRDIERIQQNMHKGCEAYNQAEELECRAAAVGSGGISSDDPEAVDKLKAKLENLRAGRDRMKAVNNAWRKAGEPKASDRFVDADAWKAAAEKHPDLEPLLREALDLKRRDFMERPPHSWSLTNLGAQIRTVEGRIKQLETVEADHPPIEGNGWRIWEDRDDNRLFICHDAKPAAEVRQALKRHGFRWNRYAGAWSRLLNASAWATAEYLAENGKLG